jgi:RNA polymerase sigma-70 factor (ECF subfamily)
MTHDPPLTPVLAAHLPAGAPPIVGDLDPALATLCAAARAAWPALALDDPTFVAFLAARLPSDVPPADALPRLRAADLYLACACLEGQDAAVRALHDGYFPRVHGALRRTGLGEAAAADLAQAILQRLLVPPAGGAPGLAGYAGRGDLQGWLCIAAVRDARHQLRRDGRAPERGDDDLSDRAAASDDHELQYLKDTYQAEFRAAFRDALAALGDRERNLLRYQLLDGLTIDQIGAIYHIHRATAARWLAQARAQVFERTQAGLMARLKVSSRESESIIRLIRSQLDVSVHRLLCEPGRPPR